MRRLHIASVDTYATLKEHCNFVRAYVQSICVLQQFLHVILLTMIRLKPSRRIHACDRTNSRATITTNYSGTAQHNATVSAFLSFRLYASLSRNKQTHYPLEVILVYIYIKFVILR